MTPRWPTIVIAIAAAAAFAMSVQGGRWWSIGETEIGPFGTRHCFDGQCTSTGFGWLGADLTYTRIGMATWAAGGVAMFVLLIVAAGVAARRVPRLAAKVVLVAITTALITGIAFFVKFPGSELADASIDRGLWLFVAGIVVGAAAAIHVLRQPPPIKV